MIAGGLTKLGTKKKNPAAVALGALGGKKKNKDKGFGSLTPEQRTANAVAANEARWGAKKKKAKKK